MVRQVSIGILIVLIGFWRCVSNDGDSPPNPAEQPQVKQPLSEEIATRNWYPSLTDFQQNWLKHTLDNSFKFELPQKVYFFSLDREFRIFRNGAGLETLKVFPAIPHAIGDNDMGGNLAEMTVLRVEGDMLEIEYQEIRGWIYRSSVRIDALVLATSTGHYLRDLFMGAMAGGSRCRLALKAQGQRLLLILRYIKTYRGEDEAFFAFEFDPHLNRIVDVFPWDDNNTTTAAEVPLKELLEPDPLKHLSDQLGLGKIGFISTTSGELTEKSIFYPRLTAESKALKGAGFILLNSAIHPGKSPVLIQ